METTKKLAPRVGSAAYAPIAAYRALRRVFKCIHGGESHQKTEKFMLNVSDVWSMDHSMETARWRCKLLIEGSNRTS